MPLITKAELSEVLLVAPPIKLLPTSIRLETMTLAALYWSARVGSSAKRAVLIGLKFNKSMLESMPKAVLIWSGVSPASTKVDSGEITLAFKGALKVLVTAAPVD